MRKVLDLFCGAGGAAAGYHRAGFDIVGIDIVPQPDYPFTFIQADALVPPVDLSAFDLVHASPPCQPFTKYRNVHKTISDRYLDHLPATRSLLSAVPHVIENVPGAPMRIDLELCGSMFGLDVRRHRWFEFGNIAAPILVPPHNHLRPRRFKSSTDRPNLRRTIEIGSWDEPIARQQSAMGIDWITDVRMLSEALPPAYTEFIGRAFLDR